MPYARTTYKYSDIKLAFEAIDSNKTMGGVVQPDGSVRQGTQPKPHGHIHGADALHRHPLFAKARVTSGDGPGTHSVMAEHEMLTALVPVFNSAAIQPFLQQVDAGNDATVNVNLSASPGSVDVFKKSHKTGAVSSSLNQAVVAFFLKIRPNPTNKDIPIIQTCVPHIAPLQLTTKKGATLGFKF